MDKREKVIMGLEEAIQHFERYSGDEYGREFDYARVEVGVLEDALELLKARGRSESLRREVPLSVNATSFAISPFGKPL